MFLSKWLCALMLLLVCATPASAAVFWDDEMEPGTPYDYLVQIGVASYDSSVKVSGAASMRFYYQPGCEKETSTCGGFADRSFPQTTNVWTRQYVRFASDFVTGVISTKWFRLDTTGIQSTYVSMLWWGSSQFGGTVQQVPPGASFNTYYNYQMPKGQWVCVEIHKQLNTPGASNGVLEAWADGVQIYGKYDIPYRASGDTSLLANARLFRQNGSGYLWIDKFATGDTRIGCGSAPPTDTTPPSQVTGLTGLATSNSVQLSWNAATDNQGVQTYVIARCTGQNCTSFVNIFNQSGSTLSYTDTGLSASTTYGYRVTAVDAAGNTGTPSSTFYVTTGSTSSTRPVLSITPNGQFAIDGTPVFLQGIGYYDCSNYHTSDIDALAADKFNLYVCQVDDVYRNNGNSAYNSDGTLKAAKVAAIQAFIDYVGTKGGVVDLNLMYANADGANTATYITSQTNRLNGITAAVNAFKGNTNVLFSVMREHNYGSCCDSESAEINLYMNQARSACSTCLITYSSSDNIGALDSGGHLFTTNQSTTVNTTNVAAELGNGINIVMPHNERNSGWHTKTTARVSALRTYLTANGLESIPVLLEEDGHENNLASRTTAPLGSAAAYVHVAVDAKLAGAAGWVYTPDASFDLNPSTLLSQITAVEQTYMDTVGAALSAASVSTRAAASFSDNFNRADNVDLGANWDSGYTDTANFQIVSNQVRGTSGTLDNSETYNGALAANQWASLDIATWTGSTVSVIDVAVRWTAPPTQSGYICRALINDTVFGNHVSQIARWDNGVYTVLAFTTSSPWAAGDTILCEAVGSTITLKRIRSGVETSILQVNDSTYASGRSGITVYVDTVANVRVDNFATGGFTTSSYTKPVITSAAPTTQGATITWSGSIASVRVLTDLGSTIYAVGSLPGGVLARAWVQGETFACFFARDEQGVESSDFNDYICVPVQVGTDTTPPTITNPFPTDNLTLPAGTTSTTGSVTTQEAATCRWDTTNKAYGSMANTFTTSNNLQHSATFTGLSNGVAYTRYVRCSDTAGNANTTSTQLTFNVAGSGGDTTAPSTVAGVSVTILSNTQVRLFWTAATDNVAVDHYDIYRCELSDCLVVNVIATATGSPLTLSNLTPGATYFFAIKAVDTSNNSSAAFSNIATAALPLSSDTIPPRRPEAFSGVPLPFQRVQLKWARGTDSGLGVHGYSIQRCLGATCANFTEIAFTTDVQLEDISVVAGKTYRYHVNTVDRAGNVSPPSTTITITVPSPPTTGYGICGCRNRASN